MPLTLERYAAMLEERKEPRPSGPTPRPFSNAKPHLPKLPDVRAVIYGGYGVLMLLTGGEPQFLNPDATMRTIALDKTIAEFKMWASMSRKPGAPADSMATMLRQIMDQSAVTDRAKADAESRLDRVWSAVVDRLKQKEYLHDVGLLGDQSEFCQKLTYFYLRASQGVTTMPHALTTLQSLRGLGKLQGIHTIGQCNGPPQLLCGLSSQGPIRSLDDVFEPSLCLWSFETGVKKESERSWALLTKALAEKGVAPREALYIGSKTLTEIAMSKRRGFRTALFLGDQDSSDVKPEHLKDPKTRPDALLTSLDQVPRLFPS